MTVRSMSPGWFSTEGVWFIELSWLAGEHDVVTLSNLGLSSAPAKLYIFTRAVNALRRRSNRKREATMHIHVTTGPIVSLIAGVLILIIPRLLNYIVAIYLIIIGLLGLGVLGV